MELDRVLVAVDGSDDANKAVNYAVQLSKACSAELIAFHAVSLPRYSFSQADVTLLRASYAPPLARKEPRRLVDEVVELAKRSGVKATGITVDNTSSVVEAIVDNAKTHNVDLIVVGSKGLSGFMRLLLGGVSSGVVTHAHCSVLVVR